MIAVARYSNRFSVICDCGRFVAVF